MFYFLFFSFAKHKYVCRPTTHQCPANKFSLPVRSVEKRSIGKSNFVHFPQLWSHTSLRSRQVLKQAAVNMFPIVAIRGIDAVSSSRCTFFERTEKCNLGLF